jgi:hypothetical protein
MRKLSYFGPDRRIERIFAYRDCDKRYVIR